MPQGTFDRTLYNMYPPPKTKPITPMKPTHHPTMRVSRKGITFSREAAQLLGVGAGDRISIEREEDFARLYLYVKVVTMHGYPLYAQNDRLCVYSRSLARRVMSLTKCERKVALYRLGEPTTDFIGDKIVPIITSIDYAERNQI